MAFFTHGFGLFILILAQCLLVTIIILVSLAFLMYGDRKIWAAVQMRRGPNVVGPFGLLQSFADFLKYIVKEIVVPAGADKALFFLAPMVSFVLPAIVWVVIPLGSGLGDLRHERRDPVHLRDLEPACLRDHHRRLGVELEVSVPRRAEVGGADDLLRGVVGFIIVGVLISTGSLNLTRIVEAQAGSWGLLSWYWLPHFPMVWLFFICALAETNRPPFDLPEAEMRAGGGYQVEYSSTPFLLFMIGELMSVFFMCAMISILFFGGWLSPVPGLPDGALWLFGKMLFWFFMFSMVKAIVPRYRYDQLMRIGWKVFLPLSLGWVVLVGLFAQYGWFWGAYARWIGG